MVDLYYYKFYTSFSHILVKEKQTKTESVTSLSLGEKLATGLSVAISDTKMFRFYHWKDIAGEELEVYPGGKIPKQ